LVAELLSGLRAHVVGKLAINLQNRVASQLDRLIRQLLIDAASLWRQDGFSRWSDGELACTVRIYDCALSVIENDPEAWALIHVQYDGTQPTLKMRRGLADPAKATRPDLNVRIGSAVIHVEAKRLHLRDGLPKKYLNLGMRRFIDGQYSTAGHGLGAMISFVLSDDPQDAIDAVNEMIIATPDLGPSHIIDLPDAVADRVLLHTSFHNGGLRLFHHAVDIRP